MSLLGNEKSIKIDLWALRGCHRVSGYRAMAPDFGASAPRAGPARVLSVNKNRYLKYRYIKTGIYNISYIKIRYIIHVSGSNTPMGRWPGEFVAYFGSAGRAEPFESAAPVSQSGWLKACQTLTRISADSKASDGPRPTRRPHPQIPLGAPVATP